MKRHNIVKMIYAVVLGALAFNVGCTKEDSITPEQVAEQYLKFKYHTEFVVSFVREIKDANIFGGKEYELIACEKTVPQYEFTVWVDGNLKKVKDTYYMIDMIPKINQWLEDKAGPVWEDAKIWDRIIMRKCNNTEYDEYSTAEDFFQSERYTNTIYVYTKQNVTAEKVMQYMDAIRQSGTGTLSIYQTSEEEYNSLQEIKEIPSRKADYTFDLSDTRENIIRLMGD